MASSRGPGRSPARVRGARTRRSADATALDDLSAILDRLDEVLYVVRFADGDFFRGTVQFVSGRAQAITGCEPREFVEDPGLWASLLHPDDLSVLQAATHAILESRRPAVREYRLRNRATGEYRRMEDRVAPLLDAGGNVIGMVGAARDVTERKLAERALEARARHQAVVAGLGQRALAESGLPGFFEVAVRSMAEMLQVDFCGVFELLPESGALLLRAGIGWAEGLVGHATVVPLAGSQAQYVLDSGEPVVVEDLACEARFAPQSLLIEHCALSGACVAIHGPEAPLGVLCAYTRERRVFAPDEVDFLRSVANVLAAAMVHARDEHDRRRLLERVISVQDDERRRVARELHDETGQSLTSLLIGLRTIQAAPSLKAARERARTLRPVLSKTLEELGRLARGLHPSGLDDLGLVPALEHFCQDHAGLRVLNVRVDASDAKLRLPPEVELMLYRVAQEALTNVVRHARSRHVRVGLAQRDGAVELRVDDDGIGFDTRSALQAAASARRLGLIGIRERVALLGGSFSLTSESGKGTVLVVRCPVAGG